MSDLAKRHSDHGHFTEAERLYLEMLEKMTRSWGKEHRYTFIAESNVAFFYSSRGRAEQGVKLFEELLEKRKRSVGEDIETLRTMCNLASM